MELDRMSVEDPKKKVAIVTFNNEVTIDPLIVLTFLRIIVAYYYYYYYSR